MNLYEMDKLAQLRQAEVERILRRQRLYQAALREDERERVRPFWAVDPAPAKADGGAGYLLATGRPTPG